MSKYWGLRHRLFEIAINNVYFLLGISAACLGYSLQKMETTTIGWSLIPLALSIMAFLGSFIFGCLTFFVAAISTSTDFDIAMKDEMIQDSMPGPNKPSNEISQLWNKTLNQERDKLRKKSNYYSDKAAKYLVGQYALLTLGVLAYVIWSIAQLIMRS